MIELELVELPKVINRVPKKVKVILHDYTLSKINNAQTIEFLNNLIVNKYAPDLKSFTKEYQDVRDFWYMFLRRRGQTKLRGYLKLGTTSLLDYDKKLKLRIRQSDSVLLNNEIQVAELIYN